MKKTLLVLIMTLFCIRVNAQRTSVETIYGYLRVFPEELGYFESVPNTVINQLNNQAIHGYNTWRIPTNEELSLLKAKGYLSGGTYMTKENTRGIVLLVTDNADATTLIATSCNGHEYVDLGLSVKWATCNVGATTPEQFGDYFAWGETSTKTVYKESNCPTYELTISQLQSQGYIDNNGNLTAQHDAATVNWGGDWRMPTYDELEELSNNCIWTWAYQNGVNGYKVEGPSGNSIFLPAAGYRDGSSLCYAEILGLYRSSSPFPNYDGNACNLYFYSDSHFMSGYLRLQGLSVRPVLE